MDGIPAGVCKYGYGTKSDRGKFQPEAVHGGLNTAPHEGGSQPAISLAKGGQAAAPATKFSGTESFGASVKHLNVKLGGPAKKAGQAAIPEGVRKFGGKAV